MEVLEPLRIADNDYLDDIEAVVDVALNHIREIDDLVQAGDVDAARAVQRRFALATDGDVARLKAALRRMNDLGNELVDRM
jgi:soluble cytochrome b562